MQNSEKLKKTKNIKTKKTYQLDDVNRFEEIQKIAYNLYKLRDSNSGNELNDWLTAESFYEQLRNIK